MKRREFVFALGSLAIPSAALAQAPQVRIGVLSPVRRPAALPAMRKRLGELGFVDGKNLAIDLRSTDGVFERFGPLARDLVQGKHDLLIAYGAKAAAQALMQSTQVVPIVIVAMDYDPIQAGVVTNLRRPGKNVTGIFIPKLELTAKRLELLREFLPRLARIFVLSDPYTKDQLEVVRAVAERMRIQVVEFGFTAQPYDFESAFDHGRKASVEALLLPSSPVFYEQRARIAELTIANRLPSIVDFTYWARAGHLASYGIDAVRGFARLGDIAASILKGAKPGEIALEQANVYEFAVNLKVAKILGLAVPNRVLLRADVVIE